VVSDDDVAALPRFKDLVKLVPGVEGDDELDQRVRIAHGSRGHENVILSAEAVVSEPVRTVGQKRALRC